MSLGKLLGKQTRDAFEGYFIDTLKELEALFWVVSLFGKYEFGIVCCFGDILVPEIPLFTQWFALIHTDYPER